MKIQFEETFRNRTNRNKKVDWGKIPIDNSLVTPARFERATYSLEGCCSIQLSYGVDELLSLCFGIL